MSQEFFMFLVRNLFNAVIVAFILSWIVSFLLKKDIYLEMKKRIRIVFSILVFLVLLFVEIPPFESEAREMMKEWYPNAKKIRVIMIEKSKTAIYTYNGYVTWSYDNKKCKGTLTISKEKRTSEYWTYDLPDKAIECTQL